MGVYPGDTAEFVIDTLRDKYDNILVYDSYSSPELEYCTEGEYFQVTVESIDTGYDELYMTLDTPYKTSYSVANGKWWFDFPSFFVPISEIPYQIEYIETESLTDPDIVMVENNADVFTFRYGYPGSEIFFENSFYKTSGILRYFDLRAFPEPPPNDYDVYHVRIENTQYAGGGGLIPGYEFPITLGAISTIAIIATVNIKKRNNN